MKVGRKKSKIPAEVRKRRARRKYTLKKKIGHKDPWADPMFGRDILGENVDENVELEKAVLDEERNALIFNQFPPKKKRKKREKKDD